MSFNNGQLAGLKIAHFGHKDLKWSFALDSTLTETVLESNSLPGGPIYVSFTIKNVYCA